MVWFVTSGLTKMIYVQRPSAIRQTAVRDLVKRPSAIRQTAVVPSSVKPRDMITKPPAPYEMGIYAYSLSTTIANLLASFGANWRMPPRLTAFICDLSMPLLMNCLAMYRARAMLRVRLHEWIYMR